MIKCASKLYICIWVSIICAPYVTVCCIKCWMHLILCTEYFSKRSVDVQRSRAQYKAVAECRAVPYLLRAQPFTLGINCKRLLVWVRLIGLCPRRMVKSGSADVATVMAMVRDRVKVGVRVRRCLKE